MELHDAIRRRAMVRSFSTEPVDSGDLDRIIAAALRSPTAGNTGGTAWVVLEGPEQTAVYFDATTDAQWRESFRDWADGLARAPVVLLAYMSPVAYTTRYAEADKAAAGLGESATAWPVPYWVGDAAFGVMTVLLGAVDAGPRRLHPGHVPGRGCTGRQAGRARRVAPLLRRAAWKARRRRPTLGIPRSPDALAGGADPPGRLVTGCAPDSLRPVSPALWIGKAGPIGIEGEATVSTGLPTRRRERGGAVAPAIRIDQDDRAVPRVAALHPGRARSGQRGHVPMEGRGRARAVPDRGEAARLPLS